jgi:nitrate/nitrite transporter NarK
VGQSSAASARDSCCAAESNSSGRASSTVTGVGAFAGNLGGMGILSFTGWVLTREGNYGPVFLIAGASYLLALGWIQVWLPVPSPSRARISVGGPVNRVEG